MEKIGRRVEQAGWAGEAGPSVPRRLSPEAGRALEKLGHAIEYLADEYAADVSKGTVDQGRWRSGDPRVEAIQVLKTLNRAVYCSGAPREPAWRRMRRWLCLQSVARGSEGQ